METQTIQMTMKHQTCLSDGEEGKAEQNFPSPKFVFVIDKCEKESIRELLPKEADTVAEDLRPTGGDYSAVGIESYAAIERKSLQDLLATLWGKTQLADGTYQRNLGRFAYELQKLSKMHLAYVAIEGTRQALRERIERRKKVCERFGKRQSINFKNTMGLISSLQAEFGVPFMFFSDRREMAACIYQDIYHAFRRFNGLSKSKIGDYVPK